MVDPMHARSGEPGSQTIQGTQSAKPKTAEQPTSGVQCRSAFLHWKPTRAARRTDCAARPGTALSGDEAHWSTTRVGCNVWLQRPEKSRGNCLKISFFRVPSHSSI